MIWCRVGDRNDVVAVVVFVGVLTVACGIVFVTELGAVAVDMKRCVRILPTMEKVVIAVLVANCGTFSFFLFLS